MQPLMITCLLLRLIAVVSVLACGWYEKPFYVLGAVIAIVVYALIAWIIGRDDEAQLEPLADQVYFVGYLSTIAAFAGVVLRIWYIGKVPDDPSPILLMSGVALLTTVLGLIAMTTLKDLAPTPRQNPAPRFQPPSSESSPQFIKISSRVAQTIEELNEQLERLKANIKDLGSNVAQGAKHSEQFDQSVRQLQQALDEYVEFLNRKIHLEDRQDKGND